MLPSPRSLRAIGGRGSSWSSSIRGAGAFIVVVEVFARWARLTGRLLAVIGERSPSDWRRCGAGINKPAAALKGYAIKLMIVKLVAQDRLANAFARYRF